MIKALLLGAGGLQNIYGSLVLTPGHSLTHSQSINLRLSHCGKINVVAFHIDELHRVDAASRAGIAFTEGKAKRIDQFGFNGKPIGTTICFDLLNLGISTRVAMFYFQEAFEVPSAQGALGTIADFAELESQTQITGPVTGLLVSDDAGEIKFDSGAGQTGGVQGYTGDNIGIEKLRLLLTMVGEYHSGAIATS